MYNLDSCSLYFVSASLKSTFYRALDLKLPKLEDLRQLLSKLFHHLDSLLTADNLNVILRSPITPETYETFQQTVNLINKLEKKEQKKRKRVRAVFHTLFLQMGLQLFNDVKLATDSLQELFKCYEKINNKKNDTILDNDETEDPYWIEVIIDLFLNLLSQNLHLLRSIIACVFPHLCRFITPTAMHQILSVLDPKNDTNPLSMDDTDSESEIEDDDESSESEIDDDDDDGGSETVNDRLRMAVREALGGYQTDEESVDIDNIDEEQGKQLNEALAQAFKQFKPNLGKRNKKQKKEDETLTHFRVRVLDLIEMYLDSEPSMLLTLEVMIALLSLLEFCVRDDHQKPLQDRVRSCLKKLTAIKKFSTLSDADETILGDLMGSLLEKGTKNALIVQEMGDKIGECCVFVIRCSQQLQTMEATPKKVKKKLRKVFDEILLEALERFFKNRDCFTPYSLFHNILQSNWEGGVGLIEKLIEYAFSDNVRLFRRNQALELLKLFYTNHRFLNAHNKTQFHIILCEKTINLLNGNDLKINEKYISKLFNLLIALKRAPLDQTVLNWQQIGESVRHYRSQNVLSKDGKVAYKKLCAILGIQSLVHMNTTIKIKVQTPPQEQTKNNKRKAQNQEAKKLKKETKLKRLQMSSEGLGDHISFADTNLSKMKEDGQDSGTGSLDENEGHEEGSKKRKTLEDSSSNKKRIKCST